MAACSTRCTASPPARTSTRPGPGNCPTGPSIGSCGHRKGLRSWAGRTPSTSNMQPTTKTPLSEDLKRLVGQPVAAIDTPALVVDLDALQRNLGRMAEFARKHAI